MEKKVYNFTGLVVISFYAFIIFLIVTVCKNNRRNTVTKDDIYARQTTGGLILLFFWVTLIHAAVALYKMNTRNENSMTKAHK